MSIHEKLSNYDENGYICLTDPCLLRRASMRNNIVPLVNQELGSGS